MKTSSAKNKGRLLQQYVAKKIKEILGIAEEDAISRPMGSAGSDIILSKAALDKIPLDIECKNTKIFPSLAALDQSKSRGSKHYPAAVWKPPRKGMEDSIIYFRLEDFLNLIKDKEVEKKNDE